MKVIVINRYCDRVRKSQMKSWLPENLDVVFLSDLGLDRDGSNPESIEGSYSCSFTWKIDSSNIWWARPLKYGEIGCSLSHVEAWRIVAQGKRPALVLEDDVLGAVDFDLKIVNTIRLLRDTDAAWEFCYLGRVQMSEDVGFVCEGLVRPGYSHCTYGYLLSPTGAKKLLYNDLTRNMMPVDEFIPASIVDHPRKDVRDLSLKKLRAYAAQPDLVLQRSKERAGSTTESTSFIQEV